MIESFSDVNGSTKAEEVRAWCVQAAIEHLDGNLVRNGTVSALAAEIEHYVLNGVGEHFDENTLNIVKDALMLEDGGFQISEAGAIEAIRKMQKAGILFRTRKAIR